jgi:hypothetical protein
MVRTLALLLCTLGAASAADVIGTWKLNTAKSKYEGIPAPKEQTVTYTAKGTGWDYSATGVSGAGAPTTATFTFVKDGEDAKTTGFPYWDTISIKNSARAKSTGTFKREGKVVGTGTRTISSDGKTMTIVGKVTLPDGKPATYRAVYEKQ